MTNSTNTSFDPQIVNKTDPYGSLEYVVGSSDDFICFDYYLGSHENRTVFLLHSVVNSETAGFIQDNDTVLIDANDPEFKSIGDFEAACIRTAMRFVDDAVCWCAENGIKHSKKGWNQDPYYLVREIAWQFHGQNDPRTRNTKRKGGIRINRICNQIADEELYLP